MRKLALVVAGIALAAIGHAQIISVGPLTGGPINPSQCVAVPQQTAMCFASDGVHVSIAGAPFSGPLPASGPQGPQGPPGPPLAIGTKINGVLTCGASGGSIPKGFTATCTFTVSGIQ